MADSILGACAIVVTCSFAVCVACVGVWHALRASLAARELLGDFLVFEARQRKLREAGARWAVKIGAATIALPLEIRETHARYTATVSLGESHEGTGDTPDDAAYEATRSLAKRLAVRMDVKVADVIRVPAPKGGDRG